MRLFSEKVEPTFTSSNLNILTVKEFVEVFFDVFEFEINGKKFIAEKVADYRGFPVVDVPLVLEGKELTAPFVLQKGKFEILFNPDLATIVGEAVEESIEPLLSVTEKAEEIEEIVLEKKETILQEIAQAKQSAAKYVENLKQQKLEEAAQYFEHKQKSLEAELQKSKKSLLKDVSNTLNEFSETITTLEKANVEINDQINKTNNKALSRIGNVKTQLEESIIDTTNTLIEKIETAESRIKDYYDTKITLIEERVEDITDENKSYFIGLINESRQSLLNELSNIKVDVPNIVIEKANGKQEVDLKGIKTELEKVIGTRFSNELQSLKRLIEMSAGGGSVAKQFANGGTMDGNLTVVGTISAQSYAGIPNPDLTQYLPISGGTVTGNLTVNGTLSTTLLEALSANITVIDIKQYELSGFNVQGNATVQGNISATGDLTVHKRLNFAGDANGANNLYFFNYGSNRWKWGSNGVGDIMDIAGNNVTIGQDAYFTRQGITIRNLGETTGATLLGEAPDVLAQRRRTGTAAQESRIYSTYTDASNYERFFIKTNVGSTSATQIGLSAAGTGQNRNLEFVTGGSTRMTVISAGNVGIGTTNPTSLLFLQNPDTSAGAESTITIQKPNTTSVETYATARWTGDFGNGFNLIHTGFNTNTSGLPNHAAVFQTNNANGILVGNGNIAGIYAQFTNSTDKRFNLYSTTDKTFSNYERLSFKPQTGGSFLISSEAAGVNTGYRSIEFQNGGSTRMTITSGGNIGVGTTTPSNSLHLDCTINKGILLTNSTQVPNRANFYINVGNAGAFNCLNISESYDGVLYGHIQAYAKSLYLGGFANAQSTASVTILNDQNKNRLLELRSGDITSSAVFTVLSTGNIGIGTNSPNEKLTVVGNISATGTITATSTITTGSSLVIGQNPTASLNATISRNGAGALLLNSNNTAEVITYGNLRPSANNSISLGDSSFRWQTGYFTNIDTTGNVSISGHLAASTKSFKIPHQTKSGYLQYGVVESDQHSVFVRGKTSDDTITLPDHWDWLVDEDSVTVQLTPIGKPMSLFVIEQNNKTVKVGGVEGNYNYTIYGTRKDVPDLIVETEE